MTKKLRYIVILFLLIVNNVLAVDPSLDLVIDDIYRQLLEVEAVDAVELQEELMQYASNPINLNTATEEDLRKLRFLSDTQIDAILIYVYKHPMETLNELDLIRELPEYQRRNLHFFVTVESVDSTAPIYPKDVFHLAKHEIIARLDARNVESFRGDPAFAQLKYKFNYKNRVQFGINISRAPGAPAKDIRYGAYIELTDIAPYLQTIVAGNYQASFGQGLVINTGFHQGKNSYVTTVGNANQGLRKYSSSGIASMHGIGTTLTFGKVTKLRTDFSIFYSLNRFNESIWHHLIGTNVTFRHKRLVVGLTSAENIYSDSVRYYRDARYNRNYFRGTNQATLGFNFRYNGGWWDFFGEVATAQNVTLGLATQLVCRFLPVSDVGLLVLYRFYSDKFDNTLAYAFSETSRLNDENGLYLGVEVSRLRNWIFRAYGDVFRFSGVKYGIPYYPSWGYDAFCEADWTKSLTANCSTFNLNFRFRAREKARKDTYVFRTQLNYYHAGWSLRTQADANLVNDSINTLTWGFSISQDIHYTFTRVPLTLQLRLQGFDTRHWDNRIYVHENDVLYAWSIPATYGQGGRIYLNLRWKIIPQLAFYLRVSETIYSSTWSLQRAIAQTKTDIHLLLRATI